MTDVQPANHTELATPGVETTRAGANQSMLQEVYGWTRENIAKPFANAAIIGTANDISSATNWLAKCASLPELPQLSEWKTSPAQAGSAASITQGLSSFGGEVAPYAVALLAGKGLQKYLSEAKGAAFKKPIERGETSKPFAPKENREIKFDARSRIGGEQEGIVYDNNNDTVTKVFNAADHDVAKTISIYQRLHEADIKVPQILEYGTTSEGKAAIVMQKIGSGDNLKMQLPTGGIEQADWKSLNRQYYALADKLASNNITIDWNLSNMVFDKKQLYVLDPSWLHEKPLSPLIVGMFSGPIGPRI